MNVRVIQAMSPVGETVQLKKTIKDVFELCKNESRQTIFYDKKKIFLCFETIMGNMKKTFVGFIAVAFAKPI